MLQGSNNNVFSVDGKNYQLNLKQDENLSSQEDKQLGTFVYDEDSEEDISEGTQTEGLEVVMTPYKTAKSATKQL